MFFIVPDVWLSWLGLRSARAGLHACLWAVVGALAGGAVMYASARLAPAASEAALMHVPGIHAGAVELVRDQIAARGLAAVLLGPVQGRPYKIYAVEWAASGRALLPLLAITIPARLTRFVLSVVAGRLLAWALSRLTHAGRVAVLIAAWVALYLWYFRQVGW